MQLRITEFTWVHTSLFALSVALVTSACDDPGAVAEEDLTVESMDETVQDRALDDELSDEAEEGPGEAVEERGWRGDDDDDHKGHKWKRDDDDDHKGHKWKRDDDDNHKWDDDDDRW